MLKIAKRYALAFFEAVIEKKADVNQIKEELIEIEKAVFSSNASSLELKSFFLHPIISSDEKEKVILETFEGRIDNLTLNFLLTLFKENRFSCLPLIIEVFCQKLDEYNKIKEVNLISAVEIEESQIKKIIEKLEKKLNSKISLKCSIDKEILAGFIVKWQDNVIDLSLKNKFETLKTNTLRKV